MTPAAGLVHSGDKTPDAVNWGNISAAGGAGNNSATQQTITGIGTQITLRADWPTGGVLDNGGWVKNTVSQGAGQPPKDVTVVSGDVLYMEFGTTGGARTVTVTNESDGAAVLDTFSANVTV